MNSPATFVFVFFSDFIRDRSIRKNSVSHFGLGISENITDIENLTKHP